PAELVLAGPVRDRAGVGHQLHRVPEAALAALVVLAGLEDARDAGVLEARQRVDLVAEALQRAAGAARAHDLHRGAAGRALLLGLPDLAHAARAEAAQQAPGAEARARGQRRAARERGQQLARAGRRAGGRELALRVQREQAIDRGAQRRVAVRRLAHEGV